MIKLFYYFIFEVCDLIRFIYTYIRMIFNKMCLYVKYDLFYQYMACSSVLVIVGFKIWNIIKTILKDIQQQYTLVLLITLYCYFSVY